MSKRDSGTGPGFGFTSFSFFRKGLLGRGRRAAIQNASALSALHALARFAGGKPRDRFTLTGGPRRLFLKKEKEINSKSGGPRWIFIYIGVGKRRLGF